MIVAQGVGWIRPGGLSAVPNLIFRLHGSSTDAGTTELRLGAGEPERTNENDMAHNVAERLESDRKELLDLTLRNPLINFRTLKARGVRIVDESPAEVCLILMDVGRTMTFLAADANEVLKESRFAIARPLTPTPRNSNA